MQIVTKAQQLNLISLIWLLPQQQNESVCKFLFQHARLLAFWLKILLLLYFTGFSQLYEECFLISAVPHARIKSERENREELIIRENVRNSNTHMCGAYSMSHNYRKYFNFRRECAESIKILSSLPEHLPCLNH